MCFGAYGFRIWSSKSDFDLEMPFRPRPRFSTSIPLKVVRIFQYFLHFDLEMCFAPQQRAIFKQLNFQKWSENGVLCTFWLGNALRATMACNFSTSKLPEVVRTWCASCILTSKCVSRHSGVQFFISHLATWLRARRFSEPIFRPSGLTKHWKAIMFATFLTFRAPVSSFLWLFLSFSLSLSLLLFSFRWLFPSLLFNSPHWRKFDF